MARRFALHSSAVNVPCEQSACSAFSRLRCSRLSFAFESAPSCVALERSAAGGISEGTAEASDGLPFDCSNRTPTALAAGEDAGGNAGANDCAEAVGWALASPGSRPVRPREGRWRWLRQGRRRLWSPRRGSGSNRRPRAERPAKRRCFDRPPYSDPWRSWKEGGTSAESRTERPALRRARRPPHPPWEVVGRPLVRRSAKPSVELGAEGRAALAGRRDRLVENHQEEPAQRLVWPEVFADQKLEGEQPEGPYIRGRPDRGRIPVACLGHVCRRSEHEPGLGLVRRRCLLADRTSETRDAEVEQLDAGRTVVTVGEKQIVRLEVAMNDPERVGLVQGEGGLAQVFDGKRAEQGRPGRPRAPDRAREGAPSRKRALSSSGAVSASVTRATCSLAMRAGARASRRKRSTALWSRRRVRLKDLQSEPFVGVDMTDQIHEPTPSSGLTGARRGSAPPRPSLLQRRHRRQGAIFRQMATGFISTP